MKQQDFMYDTWKKVKLCTRVKHPKNENDHSNHQSYSIQSPFVKDTATFRSHISRIAAQFREQK